MDTIEHLFTTLIWLVKANPIPAAVIGMMLVALFIAIVKKLFKLAFFLSVVIIAAAVVLHYFGHDTLPPEGEKFLQKAEDFIEKKI